METTLKSIRLHDEGMKRAMIEALHKIDDNLEKILHRHSMTSKQIQELQAFTGQEKLRGLADDPRSFALNLI